MPTTQLSAQAQYCRLITTLVSDEAIGRGVVTTKNAIPVLFFFMSVGDNDVIRPWLMPPNAPSLKESRWLQIVGWLMKQCVLLESKNSRVADFLIDMGEIGCSANRASIQNSMAKSLSPDILRELIKIHDDFFT